MSKVRSPKPAKYVAPTGLEMTDPRSRAVRLFNKMLCDTDISPEGLIKNCVKYDYERRQWLQVKPEIDLSRCASPSSTQRKIQLLIDTENSAVHDFHYTMYHGSSYDTSALEFPQLVRSFANVILRMTSEREVTKYLWAVHNPALLDAIMVECLTHPKGMHPDVTARLVDIVKHGTMVDGKVYGIFPHEKLVVVDELPWFHERKKHVEAPRVRGTNPAMAAYMATALGAAMSRPAIK